MKAGSWIQKVNGILKLFVFVLKLHVFALKMKTKQWKIFFLFKNYHQTLKTVNLRMLFLCLLFMHSVLSFCQTFADIHQVCYVTWIMM